MGDRDYPLLNCPKCGQEMRSVDVADCPDGYAVLECPVHGIFHIGAKTDLTEGLPPPKRLTLSLRRSAHAPAIRTLAVLHAAYRMLTAGGTSR